MVENIHESVNNGFCKYAKELWCKSLVKGRNILLTSVTRVCELDSLACKNWNNGKSENCPILKRLFWRKNEG